MNVDIYAKLDEGLTELPEDLGLLPPGELKLPGIFYK